MGRRTGVAVFAVGLLLGCGCIEMMQDVTVNPDGGTKVKYDMLMSPMSAGAFGGGNPLNAAPGGTGGKKPTPEEMKRQAVASLLTATPKPDEKKGKVVAWKDVTAEWAKDGRLHVVATAYYAKPEDALDFLGANGLTWKRDGDAATLNFGGSRNLAAPPGDPSKPEKQDPPPDFAKMTDAEWADYLLEQRISYQTGKPLLAMMFTDLKVKTVIHLPGEASDVTRFAKGGPKEVSRVFDGNDLQGGLTKFFAQDDAALKAKFKAAKDPEKLTKEVMWPDAKLTVAKVGADQFDFKKEVAAAVAAYPELRKQWGIDPKATLPGEGK